MGGTSYGEILRFLKFFSSEEVLPRPADLKIYVQPPQEGDRHKAVRSFGELRFIGSP